NRWLESLVVRRSAAVVTSTTHLRDQMRSRYGDISESKIRAILNGYDESDFAGLHSGMSPRGARLRILHAGNINALFRDPRPLFAALGAMVRSGKLAGAECELCFVGGGPYGESREVRAAVDAAGLRGSGLRGSVTFMPRSPC